MPAYHRTTLARFVSDDPDRIVGILATKSAENGFTDLKQKQTKAWRREIDALRFAGAEICRRLPTATTWIVLFEYPIPRRQKRVDTVMLAGDAIICLEFKTEDKEHTADARRQVEDYALDLRDFHERSRGHRIMPIAVSLRAETPSLAEPTVSSESVQSVRIANAQSLADCVEAAFHVATVGGNQINGEAWDISAYRPVPTIVEAAEALFAGHDVAEIAHAHAGEINLSTTSKRVVQIIREAQTQRRKVICLITGVPGAGKTLAGLNIVHSPVLREEGRSPGVFLSGNGPLVKVISAAIARDFKKRERRDDGERTVGTFIQNVHEFVREGLAKPNRPPAENVVVFDEAQRAWNAEHNAKKTQSELSEPEVMLSILDRHQDWAVLIALVGGGQEINSGEAGLAEWGRTVSKRFPDWHVYASPSTIDGDASVAGQRLFESGAAEALHVVREPALHLDVNIRSYRVRKLTEWVNAVIENRTAEAKALFPQLSEFPVLMVRDLAEARQWLRERTRGLRRCGLVASSGAIRLRADGLELSSGFRQANRDLYVNWFLNRPPDMRSSNQLEVAASEYECQGLELDWVGVCWGGDLVRSESNGDWRIRHFNGDKWRETSNAIDQQYLLNTYRVLMTRAREGFVIWVPRGDPKDPTRAPGSFDAVAEYLSSCGLPNG